MAANHRKTTANTAGAARRVLCLALALGGTTAMSPAVHDKLDATINDLKGKPETVNKRLRYKLDSSAVRASADGAAAIAGKIADGVACKNPHRLFRPSKTHEKQHKAHGASPVSHSQLGLGAAGAGTLALVAMCRRRRMFPARSPHTRPPVERPH